MCTATCAQLHKRAEKITATLMERGGLNTGDNVVLLYPPGKHTQAAITSDVSLLLFIVFLFTECVCVCFRDFCRC